MWAAVIPIQGRGKIWGHRGVVAAEEPQKGDFGPGKGSLFFTSQVCALETGKVRRWEEKVQEKVVLDHKVLGGFVCVYVCVSAHRGTHLPAQNTNVIF